MMEDDGAVCHGALSCYNSNEHQLKEHVSDGNKRTIIEETEEMMVHDKKRFKGSNTTETATTSATATTAADGNDNNASGKEGSSVVNREISVGMSEFISAAEPPLAGIVKDRWMDFVVHEVSVDGERIILSDITSPDLKQVKSMDVNEEEEEEEEEVSSKSLLSFREGLHDEISAFATATANDGVDMSAQLEIEGIVDKALRTRLHQAIREFFPMLYSNACDGKVLIGRGKETTQYRRRRVTTWPMNVGAYTQFTLHKANMDTSECITALAFALRVKVGIFSWAGTKDRRAVTSQQVRVRHVLPDQLLHACRTSRDLRNLTVGNFSFVDEPFKLGSLQGNHFTIVLRRVAVGSSTPAPFVPAPLSTDDVEALARRDEMLSEVHNVASRVCESLSTTGYLNYYGMQRFGSSRVAPSHALGLLLLLHKYDAFFDLLLGPREGEHSDSQQTRRIWAETQDASKVVNGYPTSAVAECRVSKVLANMPNHPKRAILAIPSNLRTLYVHAYQSLIWNRALSHRIKVLGMSPVVGDMVIAEGESPTMIDGDISGVDDAADSKDDEGTASVDGGGGSGSGEYEMGDGDDDLEREGPPVEGDVLSLYTTMKEGSSATVRFLTQADIDAGTYSMHDVVLPTPGLGVRYPRNDMRTWYREALRVDGVRRNHFAGTKQIGFTTAGGYRLLLSRPSDVSFDLLTYKDAAAPLVITDKDSLSGKVPPESDPTGVNIALRLHFTLPKGNYATMALREIMKVDTSAEYQAILTGGTYRKYNASRRGGSGRGRKQRGGRR